MLTDEEFNKLEEIRALSDAIAILRGSFERISFLDTLIDLHERLLRENEPLIKAAVREYAREGR